MKKNCYVYVLLDTMNPGNYIYGEYRFRYKPFYVGKSHYMYKMSQRPQGHIWEAKKGEYSGNLYKKNKIMKIIKNTGKDPIVINVNKGMSEKKAFNLEKDLINLIGRSDLGKGPLTNMTDGGEGATGIIRSKESRRKMSESRKKWFKNGGKNWSEIYEYSDETRKKMSISQKLRTDRKKHTEGTKKIISDNQKGKKNSFYGKKHTPEHMEKLRIANTGANSSCAKKVYAEGIKFDCMKDACESLGITRDALSYRIKHKKRGYMYA